MIRVCKWQDGFPKLSKQLWPMTYDMRWFIDVHRAPSSSSSSCSSVADSMSVKRAVSAVSAVSLVTSCKMPKLELQQFERLGFRGLGCGAGEIMWILPQRLIWLNNLSNLELEQPHTTTFECHRLQEHTETCCSLHRNTAFMVSSLDGLSMVASCNGTEFCSERIWHCLAPTFNIFQSIPHVFLLPFLPHDFCPFLFDSYSTMPHLRLGSARSCRFGLDNCLWTSSIACCGEAPVFPREIRCGEAHSPELEWPAEKKEWKTQKRGTSSETSWKYQCMKVPWRSWSLYIFKW